MSLVVALALSAAFAEPDTDVAAQPDPPAAPAATPAAPPKAKEPGATYTCDPTGRASDNWGADYTPHGSAVPCWLGDTLVATVSESDFAVLSAHEPDRHIALFVGGRRMPGVEGSPGPEHTISFDLVRTTENRAMWSAHSPWLTHTDVRVAVGLDDASTFAHGQGTVELHFVRKFWAGLVLALSGGMLAFILWRAKSTSMLRDGADDAGQPGTYSLARVQMAFWTVLILGGYAFLLGVCGSVDSLNASILSLMGIGAGTALGAAAVEAQHDGHAEAATAKSQGFWRDIFHGGTSGALHRIQLIAWTGIVGLVFLRSVIAELEFPDLDATLLALMGISSGTYLGFKIPEPPPRNPGGKGETGGDSEEVKDAAKDAVGQPPR